MQELLPYLPVAVTVVGVIYWFARLEGKGTDQGLRITTLEQKERDLQPIIRQIALDTASIKADLSWIKGERRVSPQINNNNNQ